MKNLKINIPKLFVLLSCVILFGCAQLSTQFKTAEEPVGGERARLRIIANSLVKAVPNKSCIDWSAPGAGTVFGGIVGSSGYRRRTLDMPAPSSNHEDMGEMYVTAGQPFTLVFMTTPEGIVYKGYKYNCSISGSFIPENKKNYEAKLKLDPTLKICSFELIEIGEINKPIQINQASNCK
ncbi:MAG: hypothetical protein HHJ16_15655 [Polaromonas sp.]|uniref:hypothetical protein n=1 Tax=Polaromonas sp. TaxID=1869339 RepID=UPI0017FD91D6|nr:hypothetical protein [Polaromonas sp.]NMM11690.1 hypothetical protein [Polaromonas sp.]